MEQIETEQAEKPGSHLEETLDVSHPSGDSEDNLSLPDELGMDNRQDSSDVPQFVCALCPLTFSINTVLNLDAHIAQDHKKDMFCKHCKQVFHVHKQHEAHEALCTDKQSFCRYIEFVKCSFCKHLYRSDKLGEHVKLQHAQGAEQISNCDEDSSQDEVDQQIDARQSVSLRNIDSNIQIASLKRKLTTSLNNCEQLTGKSPCIKGLSKKLQKAMSSTGDLHKMQNC